LEFEWDENKNRLNIAKHGIDFNDAKRVFDGPIYTDEEDEYHFGEYRFHTLGLLDGLVVLMVIHTDREDRVRLISAREATPYERRKFEATVFPSAYS
jgi:uncharacterized protein